jgi:hypothetical protein
MSLSSLPTKNWVQLLVAIVAIAAAMLTARGIPPVVTDADLAVTEFYVELAARGQLDVGPYSRFGWHHPGPLYFYVQAPLYAFWNQNAVSLFMGAVLINVTAFALLVWCTIRTGHVLFGAAIASALVVFAWRVPMVLASPWTGHVGVIAVVAFLGLCSLAIAGRHWMLPLALATGGYVAQTHVSFVPAVTVLASVAVLVTVAAARSCRTGRASLVAASVGALILPWVVAMYEAISNGGGNVVALWAFFVVRGEMAHSLPDALVHWSHGLTFIFHPDPRLPWGGHFVPQDPRWTVPLVIVQMIALILVSVVAGRAGRWIETSFAGCAALASLVGLWALTRIEGAVLDHEIFWLGGIGALNVAALAGAAAEAAYRRWPRARKVAELGAVGLPTVAIVVFAALGITHLSDVTAAELRRSDRVRIPATYEVIRDHLEAEGIQKPIFRFQGDAWSEGAGVVLRWLQAGRPFALDPDAEAMFTTRFRPNGEEDAEVTLSSREGQHRELQARPGNVTLRARHPLFVNVVRRKPQVNPRHSP